MTPNAFRSNSLFHQATALLSRFQYFLVTKTFLIYMYRSIHLSTNLTKLMTATVNIKCLYLILWYRTCGTHVELDPLFLFLFSQFVNW